MCNAGVLTFFFPFFFLFYHPDWSRVVVKIFLAVHSRRAVGCSLCRNRTTSSAFSPRRSSKKLALCLLATTLVVKRRHH